MDNQKQKTGTTAYFKADLKKYKRQVKLEKKQEEERKKHSKIAIVSLITIIAPMIYLIIYGNRKPFGSAVIWEPIIIIGVVLIVIADILSIISIILGIYGLKTKLWWLAIISLIINICWWVVRISSPELLV